MLLVDEMDTVTRTQRRVLLCADWFNVALLRSEFESRHWAVSTTEDEREAFAMLADLHYDLVVIEARAPYHDAFETLKHIRGDLHVVDTPVLVVTEGIDREYETRLKWFAPVGALHMPFIGSDFDWSADYDEQRAAKPVPARPACQELEAKAA